MGCGHKLSFFLRFFFWVFCLLSLSHSSAFSVCRSWSEVKTICEKFSASFSALLLHLLRWFEAFPVLCALVFICHAMGAWHVGCPGKKLEFEVRGRGRGSYVNAIITHFLWCNQTQLGFQMENMPELLLWRENFCLLPATRWGKYTGRAKRERGVKRKWSEIKLNYGNWKWKAKIKRIIRSSCRGDEVATRRERRGRRGRRVTV